MNHLLRALLIGLVVTMTVACSQKAEETTDSAMDSISVITESTEDDTSEALSDAVDAIEAAKKAAAEE
jgi:ABC-type glycerol-3-phosphate transport system substrate-binding protein